MADQQGQRPPKAASAGQPDCFKCAFFQITWDKAFPYGCRAMGFKSRQIPSQEVLRTSGMPCLSFRPKPARGDQQGE